MITIAILDVAFEAMITSVEDVLYARVRAPRRSLEFRWRAELMKTPIFWQAGRTANGVETLSTKVLRYYIYLHYLQRLSLQAGFMQILGAYAIRRGAGEAVEGM